MEAVRAEQFHIPSPYLEKEYGTRIALAWARVSERIA
jgi:hypothetical protein